MRKAPDLLPHALKAITAITCPPGLHGLRFRGLAGDFEAFRRLGEPVFGPGVPYWAVAWPGGVALARHLLAHPALVRGREVVDLGCGAGLVAAAAMRAGASFARAVDLDPNALLAAAETARLNGVAVRPARADFAEVRAPAGSLVCAGDLWYDRATGRRATAALHRLAAGGATVLIGDPLRPGRPRRGVTPLAHYDLPVSPWFERAARVTVMVATLGPILPAHGPYAAEDGDSAPD